MAHELDTYQGRGAMFSVRQTPWHREGVVIETAPALDEALAIAGLDWEVEKRPAFFPVPGARDGMPLVTGGFRGTPDAGDEVYSLKSAAGVAYVVVRKDRDEPLGHVGKDYTPLQNRQAFEVLRPLIEGGFATIETGGSLRGGRDVWMLVAFDREKIVEAAHERAKATGTELLEEMLDELNAHGLLTNNHVGLRKVLLKEVAERVVCANTFEVALGETATTVEVRHTQNVADSVKAAASLLWGDIVGRFFLFADVRRKLRETRLSTAAFNRLVLDPVVPIRHLEKKVQRHDARGHTLSALEKASKKRDTIAGLWRAGEGHVANDSAWEAYQGLVQALDHDDQWQPRSGSRIESLYSGILGRAKRTVLRTLVRYADMDADERDGLVKQGVSLDVPRWARES